MTQMKLKRQRKNRVSQDEWVQKSCFITLLGA